MPSIPFPLWTDSASAPPVPTPALTEGTDAAALFDDAFFLRLGFSFFVGLAAGFALKIAFKLALIVSGVVLLGLFTLQYNDLVDVNWDGIEAQYDTGAHWFQVQGGALLDFMGHNLASGASFLAGLAVGLRL